MLLVVVKVVEVEVDVKVADTSVVASPFQPRTLGATFSSR